jgi:nucleoside-diphosphate-sugar epimerase
LAKVLIVGGAGYVGGWLTDQALLEGHSVKVYDNLTYEDSYLKNVSFVYGDVLDFGKLNKELLWADCVITKRGAARKRCCSIAATMRSQWRPN